MKYFLLISVLCATVFSYLQIQTSEKRSPSTIYQKLCADCHGVEVLAFADRNWKFGKEKEDIIRIIKEGDALAGMPSYKAVLTQQEIEDLANYILEAIEKNEGYTQNTNFGPLDYTYDNLHIKLETVFDGANIPWGIEVTGDGTIFATDKLGKLYRIDKSKITEIFNTPIVNSSGQGGLMDIALHPNFENNNIIYLSYSLPKDDLNTTAVCRAEIHDSQLINIENIFIAQPYVKTTHHYGSRLVIEDTTYLYITVGDRGFRDDHPQYLNNDCGKIHRVHLDGSIPYDNPFVDSKGKPMSIWSYGHRNPQGLVMDTLGNLYNHEHGPKGGDEINFIKQAKNYGWPIISYGINYNGTVFTKLTHKDGMEQPVTYWVPSIAPSGMDIVKGTKYPGWEGKILSGSLKFDFVHLGTVKEGVLVEGKHILENIGRVREVEMGDDGYIYIGVEEPGRILKLIPFR